MFFTDFKTAISDYSKGYALLSELKLWRFILVPTLISIGVASAVIWAAFALSDNIGGYIADFWPFSFWEAGIRAISIFLGWAVIIIFGMIAFRHAVMAFSGPFMAPIAQKIEDHLTGEKTKSELDFMTSLVRSIRINGRNLIIELLITFPLLILSFIPVLNLITGFLIFFIGAYFAGFGNLDYTLERHFKFKDSVSWVRKRKGIAIGNGTVFMLILMIPFVGILLVLPLSCAAASVSAVNRLDK